MTIRLAQSEADLKQVRRLCWAYRDALAEATSHRPEIVETFYGTDYYEALLNDLATRHAPPDGAIFVGTREDVILACGMTQRIDAQTCEIKRVYVAPEGRRLGFARRLMEAAMDHARDLGYARFVLDTTVEFTAAQKLYEAMGFEHIAPYYTAPAMVEDTLIYFGKDL